MAGIYDTHAHLNDGLYIEMDTSSKDIINDAKLAGVDIINIVGYDVKSSKIAIRQANEYPNIYAIVGVHPNEVHYFTDDAYNQIEDMTNSKNVVAIGEIGLDYSRGKSHIKIQKESFIRQIRIAKKHNLPIVLHIKDEENEYQAYDDAIEILKSENVKKAIIHSYEGNLSKAKELLSMGYLISFSGEVTYKNNTELIEVIKYTSLNNMVVESDAPYSSPVPFKGQINYPKYLNLTIKRIAEIKKIDSDEIISATRVNAQKFFNV